MKTAEVKVQVSLDENNVPEQLTWSSTDGENADQVPVKALFMQVWDHNYKNAMHLELWTKDMPVDEMKRFFHQTLLTLGESFLRATGETNMVEDLKDYCAHFAEKMEI